MRRFPIGPTCSRLGTAAAIGAFVLVGLGGVAVGQGGERQSADRPQSAAEARRERRELREERADAAKELDAAKAADAEVAAALAAITDAINAKQLELDDATRQLAAAEAVALEAEAQVGAADLERGLLEEKIGRIAVEGFLAGSNIDLRDSFLSSTDPNEAIRRSSLLRLAGSDSDDLLEHLRVVREDRLLAEQAAREAVDRAQALASEMAAIVVELESQRALQGRLKAELEARVAEWDRSVQALAAEEQALSDFIREQEAKLSPGKSSPAVPGVTSARGFIWPVSAEVTSEFGFRVHPIFGTRRLHAGIDLGAPSGTPIMAANSGTVIAAGPQGGYGKAVVISHGGGVSSLYAHQSKVVVAAGETVKRGDVIGYVGSTGQSTGPHLHFEIREGGDPTNPRRFLP